MYKAPPLRCFIGKMDSKTNYSITEIIGSTLISLGIGLLGGKGLEIAGVTVGRNSFYAVFKSGLKKLLNDTASHMSIKVILKELLHYLYYCLHNY